jgi:hypothetical protein
LQSETFQYDAGALVREASEAPLPGAGREVVAWRDEAGRLVVVNFGQVPADLHTLSGLPDEAELVASTDPARLSGDVMLERFLLLPREAVLLRLAGR